MHPDLGGHGQPCCRIPMLAQSARVAKLADARDLKSLFWLLHHNAANCTIGEMPRVLAFPRPLLAAQQRMAAHQPQSPSDTRTDTRRHLFRRLSPSRRGLSKLPVVQKIAFENTQLAPSETKSLNQECGWKGGDSGARREKKPCLTKKPKNPLDSDRPSHGRPFHSCPRLFSPLF